MTAPQIRPRWYVFFAWILYFVLVFEIASQLYCYFFTDLQPFGKDASTLAVYPEIEEIMEQTIGDNAYDILLLGGSVLFNWAEALRTAGVHHGTQINGDPVRLHLAALPAHTSLDSLFKLRYLADLPFDLYVLYHGINEVRTNNVPPQHWRADYSHYSWYAEANFFQRNATVINVGLRSPFVLFRLKKLLLESLGIRIFVPTHWPKEEFLQYGSDIRSAESFRHNIERMLDIAAHNGTPFLLSTFAWYRPENYNMEDYRRPEPIPEEGVYSDFFALPIELWGYPDDVVRALDLHNDVVRSFRTNPAVFDILPMDELIPKQQRFFDDICHLTRKGKVAFGKHLIEAIDAGLK